MPLLSMLFLPLVRKSVFQRILAVWHVTALRAVLSLVLLFAAVPLWGQPEGPTVLATSRYSGKVFSEIDHLTRLLRVNLKKTLKKLLREQEEVEITGTITQIRNNLEPRPNAPLTGPDVLTGNQKDVAQLDPEILERLIGTTRQVPRQTSPTKTLENPLLALLTEEVVLVSVNVYTEKNATDINAYLTGKLEAIYFKKYPEFSFFKEQDFFRYNYKEVADGYVFSYGPQDNAEISQQLAKRGSRYYARLYFFRLSDRSILDVNIYDAETHAVVWGKRHSMYVGFKTSNLTYRFLLGMSVEGNSAILISNFIGIRLPVIGSYGIFFDIGFSAVDPLGSAFYFSYGTADAILVEVTIGPQLVYSLNEIFGFSYRCCEFFLDFQLGYKNKISIVATENYLNRASSAEQKFAINIGLAMSIRKFMLKLAYDPLNNGFGGAVGINF